MRDIEARIDVVEHELEAYAAEEPVVQALLRIPGIGVLTASALFASIGSIHTSDGNSRAGSGSLPASRIYDCSRSSSRLPTLEQESTRHRTMPITGVSLEVLHPIGTRYRFNELDGREESIYDRYATLCRLDECRRSRTNAAVQVCCD
ncbi:hypothetical protein BH23GEM9_BH23GEM9_32770 [soil metagenome]